MSSIRMLAVAAAAATLLAPASSHAIVPVYDTVTVVETFEGYPGTVLVAKCDLSGTAPGSVTVTGTTTMHTSAFNLNFISITCTVHQTLQQSWSVSNTQSGKTVSVYGSGQLLTPLPAYVCVSGRYQVTGSSFIDHYGTEDCTP